MRNLGQNKEACSADQRDEHRQLADFCARQTLHKVRTLNVLRRLGEIAPELVGSSPGPSEESKSNCCNDSIEEQWIFRPPHRTFFSLRKMIA